MLTCEDNKPTTVDDRRCLAQQIISQAADPSRICQGNHDTCAPTAIEIGAYIRHPEAAARAVADVALTGQYKALDGTTVKIDPTEHEKPSSSDTNPRSYASQIFQVTAVNVALQVDYKNGYSKQAGEYWQSDDGDHFRWLPDGKEVPFNGLDQDQIYRTSWAMLGENLDTMDLSDHSFSKKGDSDLRRELIKAQKNGWMPILISVNSDNEPLDQSAKAKDGYEDWWAGRAHSVVITSYEAGPPERVHVINPQGAVFPFGPADGISVHDLYLSMLPRKQVITALEADIKKEANNPTLWNDVYLKRLNLLRLQIEEGQINRAQACAQFNRLGDQSNRLSLSDQDWQRFYLLVAQLQSDCQGDSSQVH